MRDHIPTYYDADGKRISLQPVGRLALDFAHPAVQRLASARRDELETSSSPLRRRVRLLPIAALNPSEHDELDECGALLPVYQSDGALLIVLPEVRIEGVDAADRRRLAHLTSRVAKTAESGRQRAPLTIKPQSGRAIEALELAKQANATLGRSVAQPRFIRIVDSPGTGRKG